MGGGAAPRRFATPAGFRAWLARHHATTDELVIRCYKVHASHLGMTYREALDEALCHGWIDGVRRGIDEVSFSVRFTPRRPRSIWSLVNVRRVEVLRREGRVAAPGILAFEGRSAARTGVYSYERTTEQEAVRLAPGFAKRLRADAKARRWFETQPPWYRRTSIRFVMSAKQEATRLRRFEMLLTCSRENRPIAPLRRKPA